MAKIYKYKVKGTRYLYLWKKVLYRKYQHYYENKRINRQHLPQLFPNPKQQQDMDISELKQG